MTLHLQDGRDSCHVGLKSDLSRGIRLSEKFMYQKKYYFNVFEFLERQIHAFVAKPSDTEMFLLDSGRHVGDHLDVHQHGVFIHISINLGKKILNISYLREPAVIS